MFENILIPLLLCETLGTVKGKTRFQKLVYLIQDEANAQGIQGPSFDYELSHYGPFSAELSSMLEDLEDHGILKERIEVTPSGYTRYVYYLTEKGKKLLKKSKRKALLSTKLINVIIRIAGDFGDLPLDEIVHEAHSRFER